MLEVQIEFFLLHNPTALPSRSLRQNPHQPHIPCGMLGSGARKLSNVWKDLAQTEKADTG